MIKRNEDEYNNLLVTLNDIIDLILLTQKNEYDKVTIRAQVIKISDPAKVGKGLTKRGDHWMYMLKINRQNTQQQLHT